MRMCHRLFAGVISGLLLGSSVVAAADPRYVGMLNDGTRVPGDLANWQDPAQQPTLAGKAIFDAGNPFRWILDTTPRATSAPKKYVEFFAGDRFPGEVVSAQDGSEAVVERAVPFLIVKSTSPFSPADAGDDVVRVASESVQRVVWHPAATEYRPGTAFLRDGRALPFRSLRWNASGVTLLIDDRIQPFPFADLAEVHLPRRDAWDAVFEPLAVLCPEGTGRIIQMETEEGLRATTSTERFRPQFRGDRNKPEQWIHLIQPAWALDPLWVRFPTIRSWRFSAPNQVSLTQLTPSAVKQESYFAASTRWQRDRSVLGQTLDVAANSFPLGIGVQARNELTFDLHPAARTFRTRLGLDQAAGDGGCVLARIDLETDQRRPLFQSQNLVGSKALVDSGVLTVSAPAGQTARLTLVADPVLEGRPQGADPLDVRDFVDWLQPELELDLELVKKELARRAFARLPAFGGWTVPAADLDHIRLVNHWDESNARDTRFRLLASTDLPYLTATTKLRIERSQRWLAVATTRPPTRTTPVRVQVKIDGHALGEFEVPANASPAMPDPVLFPVDAWQGKSVTVEVIQFAEKPDGVVDWHGVTLLSRRPGLLRIFEDEESVVQNLHDGDGEATLETENPYRGKASLKVTAPGKGDPRLPELDAAIREFPAFGEYRYIRYAWRIDGGSQIALSLGHEGQFGGDSDGRRPRIRPGNAAPDKRVRDRRGMMIDNRGLQLGYRYDAGKGPPLSGAAIRLGGPDPNWVEVTRDLFADFGTFTLTGLQFGCPDGDAAWFDAIYLGRTVQDFDAIREVSPATPKPATPPTDPNVALQPADRSELAAAMTPVAAFSTPSPHDGVTLLKEMRGRKPVLRTQGPDNKQPFVLRGFLTIPAGKPVTLQLQVGHDPESEWQLVVTANGQTLHDGVVGPATAKDGWLDLSIDLGRVAGKNVLLTVEQRPLKDVRKPAYWSRAAVTGL